MQKITIRTIILLTIVFLMSCGEDSGNNASASQNAAEEPSKQEVSSIYELGVCDETNALTSTFVTKENAVFFCDGNRWQKMLFESSSSSHLETQIDNPSYQQSSQIENNSSSFLFISSSSSVDARLSSSSLVSIKSSSSVVPKSSSSVRSSSSLKSSSSSIAVSVNSNTCGSLWCKDDFFTLDWGTYGDENDDGTSLVQILDDADGRLRGKVLLGDGYEYPFAGVIIESFRGNITDWGGICLVYQSTIGFGIELAVADEETVTEYNNFKASVSKSTSFVSVDFPWDKFKQGIGWGKTASRDYVLSDIIAIKLKFEGSAGTSGTFIIQSMGKLGTCK